MSNERYFWFFLINAAVLCLIFANAVLLIKNAAILRQNNNTAKRYDAMVAELLSEQARLRRDADNGSSVPFRSLHPFEQHPTSAGQPTLGCAVLGFDLF